MAFHKLTDTEYNVITEIIVQNKRDIENLEKQVQDLKNSFALFGVGSSKPEKKDTVLDTERQMEMVRGLNNAFYKILNEDGEFTQSTEDKTLS